MPPNDILIRNVPADLRSWLVEEKHRRRTSLREFVLYLIAEASRADGAPAPSLFNSIDAPRQTVISLTPFKFIDLFAGIGGFRIGLPTVGGQCVFTSDWDEKSQKTYQAWYGDRKIHGDINTVKMRDIPDHDVLAAGFPCQPFSIAGVSKKNSLGQAHGFKCASQGKPLPNPVSRYSDRDPWPYQVTTDLVTRESGQVIDTSCLEFLPRSGAWGVNSLHMAFGR